jgi:hypothetical protein
MYEAILTLLLTMAAIHTCAAVVYCCLPWEHTDESSVS